MIYLRPLQGVFGTARLGAQDLRPLIAFPIIVWGSDELRRWVLRRRDAGEASDARETVTGER